MSIIIGLKKIYILFDLGYLAYGVISSRFIRKTGLECINIPVRKLIDIGGKEGYINKIMKIKIDIDRYQQDIFFYIIKDYLKYDLILGKL